MFKKITKPFDEKITKLLDLCEMSRFMFDWKQFMEIVKGVEDGLTEEQIYLYASPNVEAERMEQMRLGFKNGLTRAQVGEYSFGFNALQMEQIRLGLEAGYSKEMIRMYADEKFNWEQMEQIRAGLSWWGKLRKGQIRSLVNPELSAKEMGEMLEKYITIYQQFSPCY